MLFKSVRKSIEKDTDLDTEFAFFIDFPQKNHQNTAIFEGLLLFFFPFPETAHLQFFDDVRAPS